MMFMLIKLHQNNRLEIEKWVHTGFLAKPCSSQERRCWQVSLSSQRAQLCPVPVHQAQRGTRHETSHRVGKDKAGLGKVTVRLWLFLFRTMSCLPKIWDWRVFGSSLPVWPDIGNPVHLGDHFDSLIGSHILVLLAWEFSHPPSLTSTWLSHYMVRNLKIFDTVRLPGSLQYDFVINTQVLSPGERLISARVSWGHFNHSTQIVFQVRI